MGRSKEPEPAGEAQPATVAALHGSSAPRRQKTRSCCAGKAVEEVPLYDDFNCPYGIKPSELFMMNEVGAGWGGVRAACGRDPTGCCCRCASCRHLGT
jgi:hypothetical protein